MRAFGRVLYTGFTAWKPDFRSRSHFPSQKTMKGIVFTEFLEMVESAHGSDLTDTLLELPGLSNDGAYTSVGTYEFQELASMVAELSVVLDVPADELLRDYGRHLFSRLAALFPMLLEGADDVCVFLSKIHSFIHVEVHKLYPEAELPSFEYGNEGNVMLMHYTSPRPLARFGEGLILGCLDHFGADVKVSCELTGDLDGRQATYRIG